MAATFESRPFFVIGVCSRGRATEIDRLFDSLRQQTGIAIDDCALLIIDNNPEPRITARVAQDRSGLRVTVRHEPRAGIVNARNALLDAADEMGADWLFCVDDDTWVQEDWLWQWKRAAQTHPSDLMVGHVKVVHAKSGPFFRPRFTYPVQTDGEPAGILSTANCAMNRNLFSITEGIGLRFHPLFNESGGEDNEFMLRAERAHGIAPIRWASAVVFEERFDDRATLRYALVRPMYERVNAFTIMRLHDHMGLLTDGRRFGFLVLKKTSDSLLFGVGNLVWGTLFLAIKPAVASRRIGRGLAQLARAAAIVPFLLGKRRKAYGQ